MQSSFFTGKRTRRRSDERLAAGEVFGPAPGPTPGQGGNQHDPAIIDARYENPKMIGIVIRQSQYNWMAIRTRTWGGTDLITNNMNDARHFIEAAAGGMALRQHPIQLPGGPLATEFWNDAFVAP